MCLKYKVRTQEDKGAYADIFHPLAFWNIAVETHLLLAHSSGHRPGTQTTCNFNRKTPEPVGCELQLLNSVQRKFNSNFFPTFRAKVVFSGHKQLLSDNLSCWTKRSDVHNASTSSVCSAYQMQSLHACNIFPLGTETLSTQRPCFFPLDLTSDVFARTLMTDRPNNQITDLLSTASQLSQWAEGAGLKCMRSHTNIDWL